MSGIISSNICIPPEFYYNWVAIYSDGTCLSEINGGYTQSINDIDQDRLAYLRILINYTAFTAYRLDAQTGQFYHGGINISTWEDTCDVRGAITEYRHVRHHLQSGESQVYARSFVWATPLYQASLKLYIPNSYEITRRKIDHGNYKVP